MVNQRNAQERHQQRVTENTERADARRQREGVTVKETVGKVAIMGSAE